MSEEPMILHASDEVLGMMGVEALHRRIAELERERDEARVVAALFVIGVVSDQSMLGDAKRRAAAITNALTLAEGALGAVEWGEYNIGYGQYTYECVWCEAKKGKPHSPDCARQDALSAIRSVTQ